MMKKSLLTASILGIASAATGVAFAADNTSTYCKPGFYAGLQGGRGDTFYHGDDVFKQVQTNGAGVTSVTNSQGTFVQSVSTNSLTAQKVDDVGLAGRLFAGYQFNPYFALEAGYTQWNKTDFSANVDTRTVSYDDGVAETGHSDVYSQVSGEITEHAVDLVAKATLPLQYGFGVYAKAGMAYITADRSINSYSNSSSETNSDGTTVTATSAQTLGTVYTKTYQAFRPTYGAGIDYTIPNTSADVEVFYSEVAGTGGIPTASLWGMGISYKFA